jgi:hypothetical protein
MVVQVAYWPCELSMTLIVLRSSSRPTEKETRNPPTATITGCSAA